MIIWSLFDSGNGCYNRVADKMGIQNYSVGLDKENKNDHFINLNLADYSYMFGNNELWETLDKLPKPDLIIASPPCESWSRASGMNGGNACWKQDTMENIFGEMKGSKYVVREYKDYEKYQFFPENQFITRINGELCIHNTIEIIKKYKPIFWVIENPAHNLLWEYIEKIKGFDIPKDNLTYYSDYGYPIMKPTKFASNINLNLKKNKTKTTINMNNFNGYNNRSNIPEQLVEQIFTVVKGALEDEYIRVDTIGLHT